ncbi:MAG: polysaccharide deacetylase [Candidatus Thorarchaeota archaeon]|nr:polysaccharide deacetylase [Candidatus Thorarchaeota archaeon]
MEWKDGARCVVCLTFDFDADTSWRNIMRRNNIERDNPVVLSIGEYAPRAAVPRILKLLKSHELRAGFFVPGEVADRFPDSVKEIHSADHELGHHGYSHTNPARSTLSEEKEELERGSDALAKISGVKPAGYRAPAADMSPHTYSLLVEHGLLYNSTMMNDDLPYIVEVEGKRIVELPIRWMLDDWVHFGFNMFPSLAYQSGISSQEKVFEIWSAEFEAVYEEGLYFMLTMHPQIMGVPSRSKMLDRLIQLMKSKGDVWIATPKEVAEYWLQHGEE